MPRISIIIPVFNKAALTRQCLDALFKTAAGDYEVILVNDASTDETCEILKEYGDAIRVVTHAANTGFATTCNDGAAVARGEILLFLNNDTIPLKGWLDALVNYADAHPAAAVVGAKLLYPDGTVQHAGAVIRHNFGPGHIYAGFPGDHPAINKSRRFQIVTGACFLIHRKDFEMMRGFDPAFRNGFEDVDLCLRLGEAGREIHYCHESVLYHLESRTRDVATAGELKNLQLYFDRWKSRVRPDDICYYQEDGLIALDYPPYYPLQFSVSSMLMVKAPWHDPEHTDRILHDRSRQVYGLLQENLDLVVRVREAELALSRMQQPEGHRANGSNPAHGAAQIQANGNGAALPGQNGSNGSEARISRPENSVDKQRIENLRTMLVDVHEQLLQRDRALLQGAMEEDATAGVQPKRIQELIGFLDELEQAVNKIYRTRRWKWANPVWIVIRLLKLSSKPRGYWHIDEVLARYKQWRAKQPGLGN